jgi:hypothetical protein
MMIYSWPINEIPPDIGHRQQVVAKDQLPARG